MRSKSALLLAVALGCGTVAAFAATQVIKDNGNAPTVEMIDILVASKDVAVNTKISPDRFQLEKWPRDRLPQGAIRDLKQVEGKFTNQRLYQGEPLLERKVNANNESIAQTIPAGFKVFDLPSIRRTAVLVTYNPATASTSTDFLRRGASYGKARA